MTGQYVLSEGQVYLLIASAFLSLSMCVIACVFTWTVMAVCGVNSWTIDFALGPMKVTLVADITQNRRSSDSTELAQQPDINKGISNVETKTD